MLTARRERSAVPRRGRRADGPAHAPPLDPRLPVRGGGRARRRPGAGAAARRGPGRLPRQRRHGRRAWTNIARTGAPRWRFGRNEECGLRCLYHGWKIDVDGNVVEMPSEPRGERLRREGEAQGLSGARVGRLRLGLHGTGRDDAGVRAAAVRADAGDARSASSRSRCPATGRRSWKGRSIRPIRSTPALVRHAAGAGRCARRPTTRIGCGPPPTRRRACRCSATQLRLPLRGDPPPDPERGNARLRAHDGLSSRPSPR